MGTHRTAYLRTHARTFLAAGIGIVVLGLAGCGSAGMSPSSASHAASNAPSASFGASSSAQGRASAKSGTGATADAIGSPYLVKSLTVDMAVSNPRDTAANLETLVSTLDPKSSTNGMSYDRQSGDQFQVNISFSVEATVYPAVRDQLSRYAEQHGGRLVALRESVQDLTNDYIDAQSRLTNLRDEQQRLQTLLGRAQAVTDIIAIDQQLSGVEAQIESIEAHLNAVAGQVTFYTVTVSLEPLAAAGPSPSAAWNPGETLRAAWQAALAFGQQVVSTLIWVGVFAIMLLPVLALALLVLWLRRRRLARVHA